MDESLSAVIANTHACGLRLNDLSDRQGKLPHPEARIERFRSSLLHRTTVSFVRIGRTRAVSRDPDDNFVLATAESGKAKYLVTNDRDLLDLSEDVKRKFRFQIVTPVAALAQLSRSK